jgi:hypothetical protein
MSPKRGAFRAALLLWAVLQIALPVVASVADAGASTTGASARAHAEDTSRRSCVPVHGVDCVLCQYLSGCAAPLAHSASNAALALAPTIPVGTLDTLRAIELRGLPVPRGPPVV